MLKIIHIDNINPFEWDALKCPICKGNIFESIDHAGVFCRRCNAKFRVRNTAGDPGCVIDCIVPKKGDDWSLYYKVWKCECGQEFLSWDKPSCPNNPEHSIEETGSYKSIQFEKNEKDKNYYLILKIGDYCSGWLNCKNFESLGFPTQEEWDKYQKEKRLI